MNCPFHCLLYKNNGAMRSYKEFPIRMAELGTVYRYERSGKSIDRHRLTSLAMAGTLHGLFRVRGFTQDDAHIFCLPSQLTDEIIGVLKLSFEVLKKFRFHDYKIMLSTRPEGNNSVGSDELWTKATDALVQGLTALNVSYEVDPGAGAFYGPKIDIKVRDAIGRYWQCTTIQCDFNLPQRFQLEYVDASNQVHQPIMIHRAIFGSLERFFGVLIESTAGNFPLWLAPVQCRIMNITDDVADYGHEVCNQLKAAGIRAEIVAAHEQGGVRINKQIKMAEEDKIPFQIVIGKSEKEKGQVALRYHRIGSIGPSLPLAQGVQLIKESIAQSESPNAVDPDSADHWKHWFEQS